MVDGVTERPATEMLFKVSENNHSKERDCLVRDCRQSSLLRQWFIVLSSFQLL